MTNRTIVESELDSLPTEELQRRLEQNGIFEKKRIVKKVKRLQRIKIEQPEEIKVIPEVVNLRRVPKDWEREFLEKLQDRQKELAKHLFVEITSLEAAIPVALEDAADCFRMTTSGEGIEISLGRVQGYIQKIAEISVLRLICKQAGLSGEDTQLLVNDLIGPNEKLSKLQETVHMLKQAKVGDMGLQRVPSTINNRDKERNFTKVDPNAARRAKD